MNLSTTALHNSPNSLNFFAGRPRDWAGSRLIPIDHGSCLPDFRFLSVTEFVWWNSRAAKEPFSPEELAHIASIDTEHDAALLRKLGIRNECIVTCEGNKLHEPVSQVFIDSSRSLMFMDFTLQA